MRLVIIGGSDAGVSAALRARELEPAVEVHLILADAYPNYSICGLPFYLSGEVADWRALAHRTREDIEAAGITLHLNEEAVDIDVAGKIVFTRRPDRASREHVYDRLIIATGAVPIKPPIDGVGLPNVFVLHSMDECFALHRHIESGARSAVIVGGGYIGLEMADAFRHQGIDVTLIEQLATVMRTVDPSIALRVESLLGQHGVTVMTGTEVREFAHKGHQVSVRCKDGLQVEADLALVVVGVRPASDLAQRCGVTTGERGTILVDRGMRTNIPEIYAAGDCTTTWHRMLERDMYMPLGTTSHKQGRIAGENAVGRRRLFAGTLGTQAVKLFDKVVAATGLREEDARLFGFHALSVEISTFDHKVYYPGATEVLVRLVGDMDSGTLLGAQIVGAYGKEVSKRIDTAATALHHRMRVDELNDLDLSYTPPLSSPWDPLQMAAQSWTAIRRGSGRRAGYP